ncbi:MAG: hypothetical protein GY778_27505, partial [bacterium]|nr:hypothetical protein [bacterium]
PNNDDLQALIDIEQKRVRAAVRNLIHATENDAVTVDWFPDLVPGGPGSPGGFPHSPFYALGGEAGDESQLAGYMNYAPQAGLAGLAVVSLLMMVMLVRKSARTTAGLLPKPPAQEEEDREVAAPLQEVGLTEGFLEGQEVDESTLRVRNLSDQVSRMVEDDPETAADLLRRWVEGD